MSNTKIYKAAFIMWCAMAVALVGLVVVWIIGISPSDIFTPEDGFRNVAAPTYHEYSQDQQPPIQQVSQQLSQDRQNAIVSSVAKVSPAVVSVGITVERTYLRRGYSDYMEYFYGQQGKTVKQTYPKVGSGFIIDPKGLIVTNHHVIEGGDDILVTLQDGSQHEGILLGADKSLDIAILQIKGDNFPFAYLGNSEDLVIGEWAIAIGNPFGSLLQDNQPTVTVGVISALKRQFVGTSDEERYYQNMIQTDAAINPGNSGGPLLNARGEVIGVNTFIFSKSGGSIGLGFARPINDVKRLVEEILTYGKIRETNIGFQSTPLGYYDIRGLDIPEQVSKGLLIRQVDEASPAYESGIRRGDIIYEMDGIPIHGAKDALAKIYALKVGDVLKVKLFRSGKFYETSFQVKERK